MTIKAKRHQVRRIDRRQLMAELSELRVRLAAVEVDASVARGWAQSARAQLQDVPWSPLITRMGEAEDTLKYHYEFAHHLQHELHDLRARVTRSRWRRWMDWLGC